MAKFLFEDNTIMSGDRYMEYLRSHGVDVDNVIRARTKRHVIHNMNEYDLLNKIQKDLKTCDKCILQILFSDSFICVYDEHHEKDCEICIMNHLNDPI